MTDKPVSLFLNPAAGRGRARKLAPLISQKLAAGGVDTMLVESAAIGDLENQVCEYARNESGPIIVAGGDGSVHEAVNGILRAGTYTPFGLIPVGTGNDFAKACGTSLDTETAAVLLADRMSAAAPPRRVDAGKMNDRFFANGVGIGFDAKINRIATKYRWPIGDFVYLIAVLEGLWDGVITPSVKMRYDGETYTGQITLANVSNGPWVGGMFYIAPMAKNDDGKFDLVFAKPVSRGRILVLLPKIIKGTHIEEPDILTAAINKFELIADAPVPSHLDGESQELQTEFRISILKDALHIL